MALFISLVLQGYDTTPPPHRLAGYCKKFSSVCLHGEGRPQMGPALSAFRIHALS
ncbi:hypothetical protein IB211_00891c [Intestinimonas butyriciproducens]|uniref:Uncharacterized protein n=1 Tax=Intestinimonas butyriciproducens TaxID=1297617 RepID=A0A0S2W1S0_9FIRM|nr:hypothetical protein IB211_00891c [Intestinimonas butyriciproducens]